MTICPENDVLIATALWLKDRGAILLMCSPASGTGIDLQADKKLLCKELLAAGYENEIIMEPTGPDVLAFVQKKNEFWQVECKGAGKSTNQSTHRNNFDRALASVVTYFKESTALSVRLGLALPATDAYLKELRRRVRKPLRKRLDLWILLIDLQDRRSIRAVSPDEDI